jgi:tetratricopeptide (TPR) repeat protein
VKNRIGPAEERLSEPSTNLERPAHPVVWIPAPELVEHFTGRAEELARLDRWAADPQVALIGVTAWGGAGKTALVTHWIHNSGGALRSGIRGVFGWSFYADPSADRWATALLDWAQKHLGAQVRRRGRVARRVLDLLRAMPVLLVLDGLEVVQEGPAGDGFGRLLDGTLREVLAGACQHRHKGLLVMTSRFPFADLEAFDGSPARILAVPPFTPAEGAALLAAAGGHWLPEEQRRELVAAVDGHALAVGVLAGLLADRPPASDLAALRVDLAKAAATDARVRRVLDFYATRLGDQDRYLLAAVSLFARPVDPEAVMAVAGHAVFRGRLAKWTPAMVQAAVRERLAGLATSHPDGTISAHPLVRDNFRPLALGAADTAADTALAGLPAGTVTNRENALRVVEAIELLLDADHWQPADDMYQARFGSPPVWLTWPAARLGQRAAAAFVATPARRAACTKHFTSRRLGFYLNAVGLFAGNAGDLATAREYLSASTLHERDVGDKKNLSIGLLNLAQCLGRLGQTGPAWDAAAEALTCFRATGDHGWVRNSHAVLGWLAALAGDAATAESRFTSADQIQVAQKTEAAHLYALCGIWWAEWLARTGRPAPAGELTRRSINICQRNGRNADLARCELVLARLALSAGNTASAKNHLAEAVTCFRDGDYLTELADTLVVQADCALAEGDSVAAESHATEAITIAAPRGLVPAHAAALAGRARLHAADASSDHLAQGRDAADASLRLATSCQLAWHELDALRAHAALDQAEGIDGRWAAKAEALQARLVPINLDANPMATIETRSQRRLQRS